MEKHSVSRLSYLFAHLHLLSSYSFSSTLLSSNLSLLSASSLLCFSSIHIVGSLTSKLPSTRISGNQLNLPPRHTKSDPTRTKPQEGCASNIHICTAPQRERSDMHNVARGFPVCMLDVHKTSRTSRKIIENVKNTQNNGSPRSRPLFVEVNEALRLLRKRLSLFSPKPIWASGAGFA